MFQISWSFKEGMVGVLPFERGGVAACARWIALIECF